MDRSKSCNVENSEALAFVFTDLINYESSSNIVFNLKEVSTRKTPCVQGVLLFYCVSKINGIPVIFFRTSKYGGSGTIHVFLNVALA